jgi:hypothetical protein
MALSRKVKKKLPMQGVGGSTHIAQSGSNVRSQPEKQANTTVRPVRNVRPFILPSAG